MLEAAVQGALRPSQLIAWADGKGMPLDLSGATITARIRKHRSKTATASAGTFVIVDAAAGLFRWDYHANDVAASGYFEVQFTASFGAAPTPARTFAAIWQVKEAL